MLKYVFGGIFIALAWALVIVFREHVPMWPAIAVTGVIVFGLMALALYRALASQRAALTVGRGFRTPPFSWAPR